MKLLQTPLFITTAAMLTFVMITAEAQKKIVLDTLEYLHEQDPTLAFRRSCREGVCGSAFQPVPLPQHRKLLMGMPQRTQPHGSHRKNPP